MTWVSLGEEDCYITFGYNLAANDNILAPPEGWSIGIVEPLDEFIDYGNVHCNGEMFSWSAFGPFDIFPEQIADIIYSHCLWNGNPIRLLSCRAGKYPYGAAYKISQRLGVPVLAPTELLHINDETGEMYVADVTLRQLIKMLQNNDEELSYEKQNAKWQLLYLDLQCFL